jgi:cytochrome P450
LNNPDIFSSAKGNLLIEQPGRFEQTLGASDNPIHGEYKNIVKNAYNKDNIERITEFFKKKANDHFEDQLEYNISEITEDITAWVVAEFLNFPIDKEIVKNVVITVQKNNLFDLFISAIFAENHNVPVDNLPNYREIYAELKQICDKKIPATGPGIYNEYINNDPKNIRVFSLFSGPMVSGASSLIGALQFLTIDLYRENQLDLLLNDRSLIPLAVNESLRFHASTGRFSRTVTKEITMHGVNLKPGDKVAACLESANRDPNKFPDPDKFDIFRDTTGSLAWGHGVHSCIALAISRSILCSYFEILLDKIGKYEITTKTSDFKYIMTASGNDDMISNIMMKRTI